jgi:hypothetical protein
VADFGLSREYVQAKPDGKIKPFVIPFRETAPEGAFAVLLLLCDEGF